MQTGIFQEKLLSWWRVEGRVLPWREKENGEMEKWKKGEVENEKFENQRGVLRVRERAFAEYFAGNLKRDPYRVIVSEVMLQQTQVDRVIPKFNAWMEKWPTIQDLAQASLAEVLIEWQGLGYNRRARFLWLLAQEIAIHRQGVWPETEAELLKLPGIGKYTARALLSFAFGQSTAVVDVNVKRVLGRWLNVENVTDREWFELADKILTKDQADPWNQAIMDFGALICTAKNPKCESCPMFEVCEANQQVRQSGFASYREFLLERKSGVPDKKAVKKVGKDHGLKFEQTDRFFRGKIIDSLREKRLTKKQLFSILQTQFNLNDFGRFETLLQNLLKEGLVSTNGEKLKLG